MSRSLLSIGILQLFLALALTSAAQATSLQGTLAGSQIGWDGATESDAPLLALKVRALGVSSPPTTPAAQLNSAPFELSARRMHVETDVSDMALRAGAGAKVSTPAHTERADYSQVHAIRTQSREGQTIFLFPISSKLARFSVLCGDGSPSSTQTVDAVSQVGARETMTADVSKAIETTPCDRSLIVIRGDFDIVLWENDVSLDAAEGHVDLQSGISHQTTAPDPAGLDGRPFVGTARQVYMTVQEAEFRLPADATQSPLLFSDSVQLSGAPSLSVQSPNGQLVGKSVNGGLAVLTGSISAALRPTPGAVALDAEQGVQGLVVDGHDVPLATTQVAPWAALPWFWMWMGVGALGLVATPVVLLAPRLVAARRFRTADDLDGCEQLFDEGNYEGMLTVASNLVEQAPQDPMARLQLVRALDHLGRVVDAENERMRATQLFRRAGDWKRAAEVALQGFDWALHRKSESDARRWMRNALQANPAVRDEMLLQPQMAEFLGAAEAKPEKPWFEQP